jgi:TP901 family phage tail tape measure protein
MGGLGRAGGQIAGGLARVGTIAATVVAGGLVASAKEAINYESAFAGVRKTVDATEPQLKQLSSDFREMSTEIPISAVRLAGLGETAGALGIGAGSANPIGQIKEFVRVTALLGETTNVSADQAATSLGQLGNVLDLREKDYERFGSTLVDLGNKGASTEAEILGIATRSGAASKQIGMAAKETLGWASAVANLGIEEEAGGSSLQTFYLKSLQMISANGKQLGIYAKTAGMTGKAFKKAFAEDASGALEMFVGGLGKLAAAEQLAVLKALGFNDIRITRTLLGLAGSGENLGNSLDVAGTAWEANTALAAEAQKRFDTVSSHITLLKNNIQDAAITIGTGMLPGIKRFTDETVAFLKANRGEVEALGADIGKTLDGVNFQEVLGGAKTFVSVLKDAAGIAVGILTTLNQLPTPVKAAGVALFGLNKISGGMVGDIVSGVVGPLVRNLVSAVPGVGSLAAMPVRVVNWPAGGLGAGGLGGGGGALGSVLKFVGALGLAATALELWQNHLVPLNQDIADQTKTIDEGVRSGLRTASREVLEQQRSALVAGLNNIVSTTAGLGPLQDVLYGGQINGLKADIAAINAELGSRPADWRAPAAPVEDRPGRGPKASTDPLVDRRMGGIRDRQAAAGRGGGEAAVIATYQRTVEREAIAARRSSERAAADVRAAALSAQQAAFASRDRANAPQAGSIYLSLTVPAVQSYVQTIQRTIRYGPMAPNSKRQVAEFG